MGTNKRKAEQGSAASMCQICNRGCVGCCGQHSYVRTYVSTHVLRPHDVLGPPSHFPRPTSLAMVPMSHPRASFVANCGCVGCCGPQLASERACLVTDALLATTPTELFNSACTGKRAHKYTALHFACGGSDVSFNQGVGCGKTVAPPCGLQREVHHCACSPTVRAAAAHAHHARTYGRTYVRTCVRTHPLLAFAPRPECADCTAELSA